MAGDKLIPDFSAAVFNVRDYGAKGDGRTGGQDGAGGEGQRACNAAGTQRWCAIERPGRLPECWAGSAVLRVQNCHADPLAALVQTTPRRSWLP